jgi:hypothetical protein
MLNPSATSFTRTDRAKHPIFPQFLQEVRDDYDKGKRLISLETTKNEAHIQGKSGALG